MKSMQWLRGVNNRAGRRLYKHMPLYAIFTFAFMTASFYAYAAWNLRLHNALYWALAVGLLASPSPYVRRWLHPPTDS